jgi:hypothetical protein
MAIYQTPDITEALFETVHDKFQRRYGPIDAEGLDMCVQQALVSSETSGMVIRGLEYSIAQIGFEHLSLMLRTPSGGSGWPLCSNKPGCCGESLFRSSHDSSIAAAAAEIPDCRLQAFVTEEELQMYNQPDTHGQLPLDIATRKCIACLLNWQNSMIPVCQVASVIDGNGQSFMQRVSMYEGPETNGLHSDWLMHPGRGAPEKMSGFVAPMPYFAAWSVTPTVVRDDSMTPLAMWLDPQPMRLPMDSKVSPVEVCWPMTSAMLAFPGVPPLASAVMSFEWPRSPSALLAWIESDPTLLPARPTVFTSPSICRFSQLPFNIAVLTICAGVLQQTEAALACVTTMRARVLRRCVNRRLAALIHLLQSPGLMASSTFRVTTHPAPNQTTSTGLPTPTEVALAVPLTLRESLFMQLRLWPTDLTIKPSQLSPALGILQGIILGFRSRAAGVLMRSDVYLPLEVTGALVNDRVEGLPFAFSPSLQSRFAGTDAPIESALTIDQRMYLWVAVAAYLAGAVWHFELDRHWELYVYECRLALLDPVHACKSKVMQNKPLLAALPSRSHLTRQRRKAKTDMLVHWPKCVERDAHGLADVARWVVERGAMPSDVERPSLQTQYALPLPRLYWVNPRLVDHQLLAHAECLSRLKPLWFCVCCGTITQDQSRELNVDKRSKNPIFDNYSSTSFQSCRWCERDYGLSFTVIAVQLAGHVVDIKGVLWTLCSVCCQQVTVRNCKFYRDWRIVCMICDPEKEYELAPTNLPF